MYGKLFRQIYHGTLATRGPWQALVTFQQLVILADKYGCVDMTPEIIAKTTTLPLKVIQLGLKALGEPDPESRSPAEDGRRIVPLSLSRSWGWRIVNYEHYRKIRSEEERREYHRQYMRDRRAGVKRNVKVSTGGERSQPIAVSSKQKAEKPLGDSVPQPGFERFWTAWPPGERKGAKGECLKRWQRQGCEEHADAILVHVESMKASRDWKEGFVPAPLVYLNQRRWQGAQPQTPPLRRVAL